MIIFLYGSDAYRLRQAKVGIIEEYKKKYSSGVNLFYCNLSDGDNPSKLIDISRNSSIFNEHKLVVITGVFTKKNNAEELIPILKEYNLKSNPDATFLFIESGSEKDLSSKSKELLKILSGGSMVKVFEPLNEVKFSNWIRKEVELRGCSINPVALKRLADVCGGSGWAAVNEIDKLTAYKQEGTISLPDVELLTTVKLETNIFNLVDAIVSKNISRSLPLLYQELSQSPDPYYILSMVIYQFRNVLIIKDLASRGLSSDAIARKAGVHPFVVKKTLSQISKFETSDLLSKYRRLQEIDISSKQGKVKLDDQLYAFILS